MTNLENFDWGWMDDNSHKEAIVNEIFTQRNYERFFEVSENDVVMDVGASIGPFTYSILDKNPKQVFCIEPSKVEHTTLYNNVHSDNVKIIKKGITDKDDDTIKTYIFENSNEVIKGVSFQTILKDNNIEKIDFLKTDCEGGEYSIFNEENIFWIKENVKYIVGEWHLHNEYYKQKFRIFRDIYLRLFPNHEIYSVDGTNIKWDLWNEHFIEYYTEVIIYIDNK